MKRLALISVIGFWILAVIPAHAGNIIFGPPGIGSGRWVHENDQLNYEIQFENDPQFSTSPVQQLSIASILDSDLDISTFSLGDFGFNNKNFDVPDNRTFYSTTIDLSIESGFLVDFTGGIDEASREVFWNFKTIDPVTGDIPSDPNVGFLPINNEFDEGLGFVQYSVKPDQSASHGDVINASARIVFDTNEPLDTPEIFNTISTEPTPEPIPEPTTMLLLGSGLIGLAGFRRKFRKN